MRRRAPTDDGPAGNGLRSRVWIGLAVAGLLAFCTTPWRAASLLKENPTVNEVVHLPAGVTYWEKGTFRLYHHNPPLVKLVAACRLFWQSGNGARSMRGKLECPRFSSPVTFAGVFRRS